MDNTKVSQQTPRVAVIGTGEFGRAMAKRLVQAGFQVAIGSRRQSKQYLTSIDGVFHKVKILSVHESIDFGDVIILAIHHKNHETLVPFRDRFSGKVVVDVSNVDKPGDAPSNAESLAKLLPNADIVKAFNTLSASALAEEFEEPRPVRVCADNDAAKNSVIQLANRLGLYGIDCGPLSQSKHLEQANVELFAGWGTASVVALCLTIFWFLYGIFRYYYLRVPPYTWQRVPLNIVHKATGCASITLLAAVYLPGCFAAFVQISKGTVRTRFTQALDNWLRIRKPLGLYALLIGVCHAIMTMGLMSPSYLGSSFYLTQKNTVPANQTANLDIPVGSNLDWNGEMAMLFGVVAMVAMCLVGVTSLPSVGRILNMREWMCSQSYLGFACLILSTTHVIFMGFPGWYGKPFYKFVPGMKFNSQLFPWFTIALRLFMYLPCINNKVWAIRRGWERKNMGSTVDIEAGTEDNAPIIPTQNGKIAHADDNTSAKPTQNGTAHTNKAFEEDTVTVILL